MSEEAFLSTLTPEIIERFKEAIEIGKWPDGKVLTTEQKNTCMKAVIWYDHNNLPEDQRVGYVPPKEPVCAPKDEEQPIKWE